MTTVSTQLLGGMILQPPSSLPFCQALAPPCGSVDAVQAEDVCASSHHLRNHLLASLERFP